MDDLLHARCFVALKVDVNAGKLIHSAANELKMDLPEDNIRWVKPKNYHITLKFLGNINEEMVVQLKQNLADIAKKTSCFDLNFSHVITLPSDKTDKNPRVIALHAENTPEIVQLAKQVEICSLQLGLGHDKHPLKSHITIARTKLKRIPGIEQEIDAIQLKARLIALYHSVTQPEGAEYTSIAEYSFGSDGA